MATPEFIVRLRERVGHELLWLTGATAVVVRDVAHSGGGHGNARAGSGADAHPRSALEGDALAAEAAPNHLPAGVHPRYADCEVLLVRRRDNGAWTPVTGIVDPGERPAATAVREAAEEAGIRIEVLRLAQVGVTDEVTFPNGDRTQFVDHTFECAWVAGEARVADEENTEIAWVPVAGLDAVDGIPPHHRARIAAALSGEERARF